MTAYYNEIDPFAAAWLRKLIAAGHLPAGDVDERSIVDVGPDDLRSYSQCHFFAGIGGWPYALRLAGWPDDEPVWTGSCPCQPLSSAGKRRGHADERHLWPAFHRLISERAPAIVFGEQVASKDGREWFAGVRADLEDLGYACGAADLCAASVGAPHIRQRLFWVADAAGERRTRQRVLLREDAAGRLEAGASQAAGGCGSSGLGDADDAGPQGRLDGLGEGWCADQRSAGAPGVAGGLADLSSNGRLQNVGHVNRAARSGQGAGHAACGGATGGLADADEGQRRRFADGEGRQRYGAQAGRQQGDRIAQPGGATDGFWSDFDIIPCTDGKARRTQPGLFPLAYRAPGRVGRLRAYGNAIVPQVAAEFIRAAA